MDSDIGSAGTSNQRYNCVCSTHNFGQPHIVSSATRYRHYQEASADEQQRMQAAKFDGVASSSNRRGGTASRRRNNVLPATQKRVREPGEILVSASPDKRVRQGDPEVCFNYCVICTCWFANVFLGTSLVCSLRLYGRPSSSSPRLSNPARRPSPSPPDSPVPPPNPPAQGSHPLRSLIDYQ